MCLWVGGGLGLDTFIVVRNAISCQSHVLVACVSFRLYFAGCLKMFIDAKVTINDNFTILLLFCIIYATEYERFS